MTLRTGSALFLHEAKAKLLSASSFFTKILVCLTSHRADIFRRGIRPRNADIRPSNSLLIVVCAAVTNSYVDTGGCAGGAAAGQGKRPLVHL